MRRRVAEIDKHAIAQILGDKPVEARHRIGDSFVEGRDQIMHLLGVEACRRRADQIAYHDRQPAPFEAAPESGRRNRSLVARRRRTR